MCSQVRRDVPGCLGLAHDSIRLRLVPIESAWRRMHADYPERIKAPAILKLATPPRREIECLEPIELAALLDWLKVHKPNLWVMGCLMGLAGLRMLETAALRVQDVDLKARTITITETPHHKPKTRDSYRTIPVCGEALEALKAAMAGQRVRPATGELFTDAKGDPWKKTALSHRWTYTMRRAACVSDITRLTQIPARKLRAAFASLAGRLGAQDRILKTYLGHSAGDVLGNHYMRIGLADMRTVSDAMNGWRGRIQEVGSGNIVATGVEVGS